jgi:hypothetical protein
MARIASPTQKTLAPLPPTQRRHHREGMLICDFGSVTVSPPALLVYGEAES